MQSWSRARVALAALFTLSGASGLAFEVLWTRQLSVVVGGTHHAVTFVVALFMAGLGLGASLGARAASRPLRAARAYGGVELCIGLAATLATTLIPGLESVASGPARIGAASLLVLAPSALMGATFPLVASAWGALGEREDRGPGVLYALNTAGAVVGCLATGFLAIGLLGLRATGLVGASLNVICGLGALALARSTGAASSPAADAAPDTAVTDALPRGALAVTLAVAAAAGCLGLAEEVLWIRALLPYVNSSTYAFSAILATYLLGLSFGSAVAATRGTPERAPALLAAVQAGAAAAVAATPFVLRSVDALFPQYVGVMRARTFAAWIATLGGVFGKTALVLLVPTMLLGATLPLCIAILGRSGVRGGSGAGYTSAANTVGAIAGSVVAGLVVLPALGAVRGIELAAALHLALAVVVVAAWMPSSRWARVVLPALAALLALAAWRGDPRPFAGRVALGWRVLLADEGPQDTTTVVERATRHGPTRGILSNGVMYAGDSASSRRYMSLLGHLPALLSRDPSTAMVICVGTGTTAGALARHGSVRALDLVDISPAVHRTLPFFTAVNHEVWRDPRVNIREADGRRFMVGHRARYGVITLEPPPPRMAGAASLYTLQMYERARDALVEGGTIAQWIPLHGMTGSETFMLIRTFQRVFPDAALFLLTDEEAAVVARKGGGGFSGATLRAGVAMPAVASNLRALGFAGDDPEALAASVLSLGVAQGDGLRALIGDGPLVRDDLPLIEQFAVGLARGGASRDGDGRLVLLRALAARPAATVALDGPPPVGLNAAAASLHMHIQSMATPR